MWVAVALGRDVPEGVTRAVILEGRELVVWRAQGGAVQVWEDRCPHRGMRLSFGFVRGDALNCLYHGWQYGTSGSCLRIPAHPDLDVPPTIKATAYPVAEGGGFILTSVDADAGPPLLTAGRPIASIAVGASVETIMGLLNGTPLDNVAGISATLEGVSVNLLWHVVKSNKLMLHAVALDPGAVETRVLRRLHKLRADAEGKVAA